MVIQYEKMKKFTSINDVQDLEMILTEAIQLKANPFSFQDLGRNKTLGLIFMNPSFRTRLSMQKAALNLGMNVIVLNINREGWKLEIEDGSIMNGDSVEHVKDAAAIMSVYCDIVGIRCFPELKSKEADYSEIILNSFLKYCTVPIVSMESATLHPLQSFSDLMTIKENWTKPSRPKVVLTWAPHIKALPQAVPNSFSEWMCKADVDFVITHPTGYELCEDFTRGATIISNQEKALNGADFVYVKNWSSYKEYGTMPEIKEDWLLTNEKVKVTNQAKIMHCLPVRRNVELTDELLDGSDSLILKQAENRIYTAQTILKKMLLGV
jgi:N-succinyl-L-ornithine transcarbamylase